MAAPVMNIAEALAEVSVKEKMNETQVSVTEIQSDDSPVDRLTIHSPTPRMTSGMKSPRLIVNEHTGMGGFNSPDVCALPPAPRVASPTGSVRSSFTSRRRVSRHSHWSRGSHSHHVELSRELTRQAESEFFSLMELMTSVSRRSMSLKEVWAKIISERETHCIEMEHMYEQFEEFTEIIKCHEKEKHNHNHEHEERKKLLIKLELDLKVALEASAGYKKKLHDRDTSLEKCRGEIAEFKDNYKYLEEKHEKTEKTLQETQTKLLASESRCHQAEEDASKHHGEIRSWKQKYSLLESSSTEVTTKYESTHKELISTKQALTVLKKEKHDWSHTKEDLSEELRKCHKHEKDLKTKITELTESYEKKLSESKESYEKKKREVSELTESLTKTRHQRDELHTEIKVLKTRVEEWTEKSSKAEDECRRYKRRYDECDTALVTLREEYNSLQVAHDEVKVSIGKKSEELRVVKVELEEVRDECHGKGKEVGELRARIVVLQESVQRSEKTVCEKSEVIHSMSERIERVERERDDACRARDDACGELAGVQKSLVELRLSFEMSVAEHNTACEKLRECERRYESVCESMTEFHESGGEWEEEIAHLQEQLRECREQKERAIGLRKEADRERDESLSRYEAKCREVERLEERVAKGQHSHAGGRVRKWASSTYSRSVIGEEDEVRSQDLTL